MAYASLYIYYWSDGYGILEEENVVGECGTIKAKKKTDRDSNFLINL